VIFMIETEFFVCILKSRRRRRLTNRFLAFF
jgi:hypothetical protein